MIPVDREPGKYYLGDGVYAVADEWGSIIITTENGVCATNRIVLEPDVYGRLLEFVEHVSKPEPTTKKEHR